MPLPPPLPDPAHLETRLMVVAEMLDRAVEEVRRAMADLKGEQPAADVDKPKECADHD